MTKTSEQECDLKCNLCDAPMNYTEFKGTHIWVCQECLNIQFEYIKPDDPQNLLSFITKNN